jgi:hypothetical protein
MDLDVGAAAAGEAFLVVVAGALWKAGQGELIHARMLGGKLI